MMLVFDPMYYLILAPALILAAFAHFRVKSTYAKASKMGAQSGLTGAEVTKMILQSHDITDVRIEGVPGHLSDHYDPKAKALRLSPDVFQGRSVAALGIAAHEAGHAIQDKVSYGPLRLRNGIVPLAAIGPNASWIMIILGSFMGGMRATEGSGFNFGAMLIWGGIILFSFFVLFQLINLPVEFDASRRAKDLLKSANIVAPGPEAKAMNSVLNAAALTYVAATLTAILTLLYFLMRAGLLGGSRN